MRYFYLFLASLVLFISIIVFKRFCWCESGKTGKFWFRKKGALPELANLESWLRRNFDDLSEDLVRRITDSVQIISENIADEHGINFLAGLNGGKESIVVLDLIMFALAMRDTVFSREKNVTVFCFEQKYEFPELIRFRERASKEYFETNIECVETDDFRFGLKYLKDKYPLLKKVFLGVRKTDPFGNTVEVVCPTTNGFPEYTRIHPVLEWDYGEVWEYILKLGIPYPKLYDEGYTSLGTTKNTRKNPKLLFRNEEGGESYLPAYMLEDGDYERSGRV